MGDVQDFSTMSDADFMRQGEALGLTKQAPDLSKMSDQQFLAEGAKLGIKTPEQSQNDLAGYVSNLPLVQEARSIDSLPRALEFGSNVIEGIPHGAASLYDAGAGLLNLGMGPGPLKFPTGAADAYADMVKPTMPGAFGAGSVGGSFLVPVGAGVKGGASLAKTAFAGGVSSAAIGTGNRYAHGNQIDPLATSLDFAIGGLLTAGGAKLLQTMDKTRAMALLKQAKNDPNRVAQLANETAARRMQPHVDEVLNEHRLDPDYQMSEPLTQDEQAWADWAARSAKERRDADFDTAKMAARADYNSKLDEQVAAETQSRMLKGYVQQRENQFSPFEAARIGSKPNEGLQHEIGSSQPAQTSTREQALNLRTPPRLPNANEQRVLLPVAKAKHAADIASQKFESAFSQLAKEYGDDATFSRRAAHIPPEETARMRDEARKLAGISEELVKQRKLEPNVIRDENASRKLEEYRFAATSETGKAIETKLLAQKAKAAQADYEVIRDKAKIHSLLSPSETVVIQHEGSVFRVQNRVDARYKVPPSATPDQNAVFKSEYRRMQDAYRENLPLQDGDLKPNMSKLAAQIAPHNLDAAKVLKQRSSIVSDPLLSELAAKHGILDELENIFSRLINDESGSASPGYAGDVAMLPFKTLAGAIQRGRRLAAASNLSEWAHRFALNELNSDIFSRSAEPEFVAKWWGLIAQRALATQGVEMPGTLEGQAAVLQARFWNANQISGNVHLNQAQKNALILDNELMDIGAKLINDYIGRLEDPHGFAQLTGAGGLKRVLRFELEQNWDRKSKAQHSFINELIAMVGRGSTNAVQLANISLHAVHAVEAQSTLQALAPKSFLTALKLVASKDKVAHEFARSWNTKLPMAGVRDDTGNVVADAFAKAQRGVAKKALGTKYEAVVNNEAVQLAAEVLSGRKIESEKMHLALLTASEEAAREMKYAGGGQGLRRDMLDAMTGKGSLSDERRIEAATHMWQFMNRSMGAGPLRIQHQNIVDRLNMTTGGIARIAAPFTRTLIQANRFQMTLATEGLEAMAQGDIATVYKKFSTLIHSNAVIALWAGAAVIPEPVRQYMAQNEPEKLHELEGHLEKMALIGNMFNGRITHVRPTIAWYSNVGENFISQGAKYAARLVDKKTKPDARLRAGVMLAAMAGIDNIANVLSFETMRKIFKAYSEASRLGGTTQGVYTHPKPFGLSESQRVANRLYNESPIAAAARTLVQPGHETRRVEFEMVAMNNHDAEQQLKSQYGDDIHHALSIAYNALLADSRELRSVERVVEKAGAEVPPQLERAQLELEAQDQDAGITINGKQVRVIEFWSYFLQHLKEHPELSEQLKGI